MSQYRTDDDVVDAVLLDEDGNPVDTARVDPYLSTGAEDAPPSGGEKLRAAAGAVITLVLGVSLTFADQYIGASKNGLDNMGLRIPALIAGLLITAQGVVLWQEMSDGASEPGEPAARKLRVRLIKKPDLPVQRGADERTAEVEPAEPKDPADENATATWVLIGLGVWLGWANLNYTPHEPLTLLCLISSIVLVSIGYGRLVRSQNTPT